MRFEQASLETCAKATGVVVVIDVIRAFTTAAFAFDAGAETITLVSTVEEALELREQTANGLTMGEVRGLRPPAFDLSNSPAELLGADLAGCQIIHRTSNGTQGVVRSEKADRLLAGSFCCAQATVEHIRTLSPEKVTFVITGLGPDGRGEEDVVCAEYLEALLRGEEPDPAPYIRRVTECRTSQYVFANPDRPAFDWADIECCIDVDRFDFSLVVERQDGLFVMRPVKNQRYASILLDTEKHG